MKKRGLNLQKNSNAQFVGICSYSNGRLFFKWLHHSTNRPVAAKVN